MRIATLLRRFSPRPVVTLLAYRRFRCFVSPRAEVELSAFLEIGAGTTVGSFTKIKASDGPLHIGENVQISTGCCITSHAAGVTIGDDCLIGPNVSILGNNYRYDDLSLPIRLQGTVSARGIRIAADVWIGAGCCLLEGADVGPGSILAPNSVVAGPIPPGSIVQGNPAAVIFTRR
jgi:acetyltransferase-like isoleucine patch superfamily enzyme